MIEYLLLFALGFLAATLLALIIAPVIHRRIITLTERRIRASVPLSTAEIRAEKDSARAAYAVENARLAVELRDQRDHLSNEMVRSVRLQESLAEAHAENVAARQTIEAANEEAGALRSQIRDHEAAIATLQADLGAAEREATALKRTIAGLDDRIADLTGEIEELKIDLATRDTEAENFRVQLQALRDERAVLREQLRGQKASVRETEVRLKREGSRVAELDERLSKTLSTLTEREQMLQRRADDIARLKERQKQMAVEARDAAHAIRAAKTAKKSNGGEPAKATALPAPNAVPSATSLPSPVIGAVTAVDDRDEKELIEHLKARQAAVSERLLKAKDASTDKALRKEIAEIAALMIELTAMREGSASPIFKTLAGADIGRASRTGEPSLAARANQLLS